MRRGGPYTVPLWIFRSMSVIPAFRISAGAIASALTIGAIALPAQQAAHAAHGAASVAAQAPAGPGVYELASDGKGSLFVAFAGSRDKPGGGLITYDAATLKEKKRVELGSSAPYGMGINSKTGILYTTNTRAGNITAIEAATGKIVATITDPTEANAHLFRVLVDEASNTVYASVTGGRIWVIDGKTNTLTRVLENVGATTIGLALDPASNQLYAANMGHNQVAVIDLKTGRVTRRISTDGKRSSMLALDAATSRLFVSNQESGDVSVIDLKENKVIKTIPTGGGALGMSFVPQHGRVYVANRQAGTVSIIDAKTLDKVADVPVAGYPNTVFVDGKGDVFVTSKLKTAKDAQPAGDLVVRMSPPTLVP